MKEFITKNFEEFIAAILLCIATGLVLVNVFMRYFLHTGLFWTEEVVTTCFVWAIFIGAAGAFRTGAQLGIDLLVSKLPAAPRKAVRIIVQIALIVINAYIVKLAITYVSNDRKLTTSVLGLTRAVVSSSLIVGFGLITIYSVVGLVKILRESSGPSTGSGTEERLEAFGDIQNPSGPSTGSGTEEVVSKSVMPDAEPVEARGIKEKEEV